jgi:hypothetical protein
VPFKGGAFKAGIVDGGDAGPKFRVTLVPDVPDQDLVVRFWCMHRPRRYRVVEVWIVLWVVLMGW